MQILKIMYNHSNSIGFVLAKYKEQKAYYRKVKSSNIDRLVAWMIPTILRLIRKLTDRLVWTTNYSSVLMPTTSALSGSSVSESTFNHSSHCLSY